jgi:hypothetical protein
MPHQEQHPPLHAPPSEVLTYLKGVHFPCQKKDLLDAARKNHAPDNVIRAIEIMYAETFSDMDDVRRNLEKSEARAASREHRA